MEKVKITSARALTIGSTSLEIFHESFYGKERQAYIMGDVLRSHRVGRTEYYVVAVGDHELLLKPDEMEFLQ